MLCKKGSDSAEVLRANYVSKEGWSEGRRDGGREANQTAEFNSQIPKHVEINAKPQSGKKSNSLHRK